MFIYNLRHSLVPTDALFRSSIVFSQVVVCPSTGCYITV